MDLLIQEPIFLFLYEFHLRTLRASTEFLPAPAFSSSRARFAPDLWADPVSRANHCSERNHPAHCPAEGPRRGSAVEGQVHGTIFALVTRPSTSGRSTPPSAHVSRHRPESLAGCSFGRTAVS